MTRLQSIVALRDSHALSATEAAIDSIRDWLDRWGETMEPEERVLTRAILGGLIEVQVGAVQQTTSLGETISRRLAAAHAECDAFEARLSEEAA